MERYIAVQIHHCGLLSNLLAHKKKRMTFGVGLKGQSDTAGISDKLVHYTRYDAI